jgi:hypothetical protein
LSFLLKVTRRNTTTEPLESEVFAAAEGGCGGGAVVSRQLTVFRMEKERMLMLPVLQKMAGKFGTCVPIFKIR